MNSAYVESLGRKAAELLKNSCGASEAGFEKPADLAPAPELAAAVDFSGRLPSGQRVRGQVGCGFDRAAEAGPFAAALAEGCGLNAASVNPADIIAEFLNILIGLTAADWAEVGFELEFSPPRNISGQARPVQAGPGEEIVALRLWADACAPPAIWAVVFFQ